MGWGGDFISSHIKVKNFFNFIYWCERMVNGEWMVFGRLLAGFRNLNSFNSQLFISESKMAWSLAPCKKSYFSEPPPLSEENVCRLARCCRICRICSHKAHTPDIKYSHNQNISPDLIICYTVRLGLFFILWLKKITSDACVIYKRGFIHLVIG